MNMKTKSRAAEAVAATDKKPPQVPDRNDALTNGWDAVFAINFNNANTAIVTEWPKVNAGAKFIKEAQEGFAIKGEFDPWQLTIGGGDQNIRMSVPFTEGSTFVENGTPTPLSKDGKPTEIIISIGMEWVPDPGQKFFVIDDDATIETIKADLNTDKVDADIKAAFAKNGITLPDTAKALVITKDMEWNISTGSNGESYYIFYSQDKDNNKFLNVYKYDKSWANNLKLLSKAVSKTEPAVVIITIENNPLSGIAEDVFPALLSKWFNANILSLIHI